MPKGRPFGKRIREVCEALEKHGPAGASQLASLFPDLRTTNISDYCGKAVSYGLLEIKHALMTNKASHVWAVKPNWRHMIDAPWAHLPDKPVRQESNWRGVSSVFQMA